MPKYGEVREDGMRFRGYQRTKSGQYEQWLSPVAWEARKERLRKWTRNAAKDPVFRARSVVSSLKSQRKLRVTNYPAHLLRRAKTGARRHGREFALAVADIQVPEFCPVLGIRLDRAGKPGADDSPSVDRIDNAKGYVPGNIVVVSRRANAIKRDATLEELRRIADFYCSIKPPLEPVSPHSDQLLPPEPSRR